MNGNKQRIEYHPDGAIKVVEVDRREIIVLNPKGCICPPGAEATCKGVGCPRRGLQGVGQC